MNYTCHCGHRTDHPAVEPEFDFGFWGWFALLLLGTTARPKEVRWRCRHCNEVLRATRNPRELEAFR